MEVKQQRREFKFVLDRGQASTLRSHAEEHIGHDAAGPDGYRVSSEYYDSPDFQSYWEKLSGTPSRRRLRSRAYGSTGSARPPATFIEIKHKLDGEAVKRRILVVPADVNALAQGLLPRVSNRLEERIRTEIEQLLRHEGQRPVMQIQYLRQAYDDGPGSRLRITFDSIVRCRYPGLPLLADQSGFGLPLLGEGMEIMEVKTCGPVPYWFRQLTGRLRLVPRGFSKYVTALELYRFHTRTPLPPRRRPAIGRIKPPTPAPHDTRGIVSLRH